MDKAGLLRFGRQRVYEVICEIVEKVEDQIIAIVQIHKQVVCLAWQVDISSVWDHHHLGLFQRVSQIEKVHALIICEETYPGSVTTRQGSLTNDALNCVSCLLNVARVDRWLRDVKQKNVGRRHRWSIHVLHACLNVDSAIKKLGAFLNVLSDSVRISWRVVMLIDGVNVLAKVADPLCPAFDELHERVDVCAAVFTADDWLIIEAGCRDRLP